MGKGKKKGGKGGGSGGAEGTQPSQPSTSGGGPGGDASMPKEKISKPSEQRPQESTPWQGGDSARSQQRGPQGRQQSGQPQHQQPPGPQSASSSSQPSRRGSQQSQQSWTQSQPTSPTHIQGQQSGYDRGQQQQSGGRGRGRGGGGQQRGQPQQQRQPYQQSHPQVQQPQQAMQWSQPQGQPPMSQHPQQAMQRGPPQGQQPPMSQQPQQARQWGPPQGQQPPMSQQPQQARQWGPPQGQPQQPQQARQWGPPQGQQQPGPQHPQQTMQRGPPQGQQLSGSQQQQGKGRGRGQSPQKGAPPPGLQSPPSEQSVQPIRARDQAQPAAPQEKKGVFEAAASAQPSSGDRGRSILSLTEQMKETSLLPVTKKIVPGTRGRPINIETNYLKLDLGQLKVAYHYDVQIEPDTPKKFLRDVMEQFRRNHFSNRHPAFDGRKNLYSPYKLLNIGQEISDEIKVRDDVNDREKTFKVTVKFANEVDLTPLHNIRMTQLTPQEAVQCVEIVLRSAPSMRCIQAGRSFFTRPERIIDLGEGMEMYQGFYQSVVRGWKPLLNVDVAHKAFPKETDLINLTIELCSSYYERLTADHLMRNRLNPGQQQTLTKFLKTLRVVYEIRGQPGSKREYRVNGLDDCARDRKFRPDNGPEMTIEQYFATKKNYRLQFPFMPTIWVGSLQRKDRILLPAELCTIVPGQTLNRKMTENQTSAMIKHAATSTTVRKQKIMRSLDNTRHNQDLCIQEFGFRIGNDFEQIQARVLAPPRLSYENETKKVQPSRGVWKQDNIRFLRGASINKWTIISACGSRVDLDRLADMIFNFAPKSGMSITSKAAKPFPELRGRAPSFRDILSALQDCGRNNFDLVFVVIPDSGTTYSDVKKAAELNVGCLTQCIKRKTMNKLNPSTVSNILLKVNSKLNGVNHCLDVNPPILRKPCMVMGADVTHPSPDSQHIPSVAAVTASHDPKAFCYNITCRLQPPRAEIITDLQQITRDHLLFFYRKNNGQRPYSIVFFRDGVSEGQFNEVFREEVRAIRNACTSLQADYQPKITFLVVQKRHHTRFFPRNERDSEDRNFNVPAGTCVDTHITNPMLQDFYLVSHASIQGVAKPTKYCTLADDNDMSNDDIEELAYHLCFLFSRCNRSVSYPAPTYYAHLAAARAKVYIENDNLNLNNLQNEQRKIKILDSIRIEKPMFFV